MPAGELREALTAANLWRECDFSRAFAAAMPTSRAMAWEVELSERVQRWQRTLDPLSAERLAGALAQLQRGGPGLGRPFVDTIKGSRYRNMKELRVGSMRALFAFDPRRHAMVMVAGDKANDWHGWYQRNIPVADRFYDQHLRSIGGGEIGWRGRGTGGRSAQSGR